MKLFQPSSRLILAAFLMDFAIGVAGLGFVELAISLHASPALLGLVGTAGVAAYTLGCLFSGRLSDRYGRRRSVLAACWVTGAAWSGFWWVRHPHEILFILPVAGLGLSLFWPPVQAWLGELSAAGGKRELSRNLGWFNRAWCVGLIAGPVACGYLWSADPRLPFVCAIGALVLLLALAWGTPRPDAEQRAAAGRLEAAEAPPAEAAHPHAELFLQLAWVGNFASSFAMGSVKTLYPKLGHAEGLPPEAVGWIVASLHIGQLLMFWLGGRSDFWHYRLAPMLALQGLAAAGLLLAFATGSPGFFVFGFALAGVCAGMTYLGSLFYSLHGNTADRGNKAGLHEAVLGSGVLLGPLLGGQLMDATTLRAPYPLAAGVFLAAAAVQLFMVARHRRPERGGRP